MSFDPCWLPSRRADAYFAELMASVPWEQGTLSFFGKSVPEPRLSAWFGSADYVYSGRRVRAREMPPALHELTRSVELALGQSFNSVLLNLYRDGRDSMGLHADDEPELGRNPFIASVSLGATRRFILRPKRGAELAPLSLLLSHGSLLTMAGACQHVFRHGVPKAPAINEPRINLTFRQTRA
ncbi:MAG TPA: alpha-ketoglutarate-dependent dioxygenase AlkB [Polyangiaceae bacterium]|nr:alpha-ketoglutarate-dependent dioxygenase AlkB [Polyangiaceae bacterium]